MAECLIGRIVIELTLTTRQIRKNVWAYGIAVGAIIGVVGMILVAPNVVLRPFDFTFRAGEGELTATRMSGDQEFAAVIVGIIALAAIPITAIVIKSRK